MASPKKASVHQDRKFEIAAGVFIPLRVYKELRRGYRASVGKKQLIFRFPHGLTPTRQQVAFDELTTWARETFIEKPTAFKHLIPRKLSQNGSLIIMDSTYTVNLIRAVGRNSSKAYYDAENDHLIHIELTPLGDPDLELNKVQTLISRLSGQKYLPEVTRRVHELNQLHFKRPIKAVKLKLAQTRWGSCSSSGNINLSTRLLLVPAQARDAVIVHELSHLVYLNHSQKFWDTVEKAMPDYRKWHQFLDTQGSNYQFTPI